MATKLIPDIGYGNSGILYNSGSAITIELYSGTVAISLDDIDNILSNWGSNDHLGNINDKGIDFIGFVNNHLSIDDLDGCGIYWSKDDFYNNMTNW